MRKVFEGRSTLPRTTAGQSSAPFSRRITSSKEKRNCDSISGVQSSDADKNKQSLLRKQEAVEIPDDTKAPPQPPVRHRSCDAISRKTSNTGLSKASGATDGTKLLKSRSATADVGSPLHISSLHHVLLQSNDRESRTHAQPLPQKQQHQIKTTDIASAANNKYQQNLNDKLTQTRDEINKRSVDKSATTSPKTHNYDSSILKKALDRTASRTPFKITSRSAEDLSKFQTLCSASLRSPTSSTVRTKESSALTRQNPSRGNRTSMKTSVSLDKFRAEEPITADKHPVQKMVPKDNKMMFPTQKPEPLRSLHNQQTTSIVPSVEYFDSPASMTPTSVSNVTTTCNTTTISTTTTTDIVVVPATVSSLKSASMPVLSSRAHSASMKCNAQKAVRPVSVVTSKRCPITSSAVHHTSSAVHHTSSDEFSTNLTSSRNSSVTLLPSSISSSDAGLMRKPTSTCENITQTATSSFLLATSPPCAIPSSTTTASDASAKKTASPSVFTTTTVVTLATSTPTKTNMRYRNVFKFGSAEDMTTTELNLNDNTEIQSNQRLISDRPSTAIFSTAPVERVQNAGRTIANMTDRDKFAHLPQSQRSHPPTITTRRPHNDSRSKASAAAAAMKRDSSDVQEASDSVRAACESLQTNFEKGLKRLKEAATATRYIPGGTGRQMLHRSGKTLCLQPCETKEMHTEHRCIFNRTSSSAAAAQVFSSSYEQQDETLKCQDEATTEELPAAAAATTAAEAAGDVTKEKNEEEKNLIEGKIEQEESKEEMEIKLDLNELEKCMEEKNEEIVEIFQTVSVQGEEDNDADESDSSVDNKMLSLPKYSVIMMNRLRRQEAHYSSSSSSEDAKQVTMDLKNRKKKFIRQNSESSINSASSVTRP